MRLSAGGGEPFPAICWPGNRGTGVAADSASRHRVPGSGRGQFVEQLRRTWDPGMARQIAAHLTLVYPEEIPDAAELAARAALAAARTPLFTIAVGSPVHAGSPADGVFLRVDDVDGGIGAFRPRRWPPWMLSASRRTSRWCTPVPLAAAARPGPSWPVPGSVPALPSPRLRSPPSTAIAGRSCRSCP